MIVTITRPLLSPRIRYNIEDEGGTLTFDAMCVRLRQAGIDVDRLIASQKVAPRLPFLYLFGRRDSTISYMGANIYPEDVEAGLYLFGRRDSTISYMGANIYPEDVEAGLLANATYAPSVGAFCLELREDEQRTGEVRPCIHVEVTNGEPSEEMTKALQHSILQKLCEASADFRQSLQEDASTADLRIVLHPLGEGPFAQNNGRIKRRYILGGPQAGVQQIGKKERERV